MRIIAEIVVEGPPANDVAGADFGDMTGSGEGDFSGVVEVVGIRSTENIVESGNSGSYRDSITRVRRRWVGDEPEAIRPYTDILPSETPGVTFGCCGYMGVSNGLHVGVKKAGQLHPFLVSRKRAVEVRWTLKVEASLKINSYFNFRLHLPGTKHDNWRFGPFYDQSMMSTVSCLGTTHYPCREMRYNAEI